MILVYLYLIKRTNSYHSWNNVNWAKVNYFIVNLKFLITKAKKIKNPNIRKWQIILMRSRANILYSILKITSASDGIFFSFNKVSIVFNDSLRWQLFLYLSKLNFKDLIILFKSVKTFRFNGFSIIKCLVVQNMLVNSLSPEWQFILNNSYSNSGFSFIDTISSLYFLLLIQKSNKWVLTIQLNFNSSNITNIFLVDDFWSFSLYQLSIFFLRIQFFDFFKLDIWQFFDVDVKLFFESFTIFPLILNIFLVSLNRRFFDSDHLFWCLNKFQTLFSFIRYINNFIFIASSYLMCSRICIFLESFLNENYNLFSISIVSINHIQESFIFLGCRIKHKYSLLFLFPSYEVVSILKKRLKNIWFRGLNSVPSILILKINPILRNWINYFRPFLSENILTTIDFFLWFRCWRYAKRLHSSKSSFWIYHKYFSKKYNSTTLRFFGFLNDRKVFLLKVKDFRLSRELLLKDLKYSYKFFLGSTFWSSIIFTTFDKCFFKNKFYYNCFFVCVLCRRLIFYNDLVSLFLSDLFLIKSPHKKNHYVLIFHRKCFSNLVLFKAFSGYIQFRFLILNLSRLSF
uniref:Group II intron reverse transcriptase/maturase mat6 n=1 Tax=Eutreptia sp. CCAC 1914B TaxID=2979827 RepID=A0A977K7Z1_9EUGL|nr:putative group II intron reverse transcriptase/maturase mat6 [Eutreptia sp. CCAC 1914B]